MLITALIGLMLIVQGALIGLMLILLICHDNPNVNIAVLYKR
jgi:hypothetical protein